jgi:ribosomal protein S18 acetylase RimI-like enzyme
MNDPIYNLDNVQIDLATKNDLLEILSLQKRAFVQEAEINNGNYNLLPIKQTFQSISLDFQTNTYIKATINSKIIGAVRAQHNYDTCYIGRLIVEPIFQGHGIGSKLLTGIETHFSNAKRFELFTAENSLGNVSFYKNRGYQIYDKYQDDSGVILLKFEKFT